MCLVSPATSINAECILGALRRLETYLLSTMTQAQLKHAATHQFHYLYLTKMSKEWWSKFFCQWEKFLLWLVAKYIRKMMWYFTLLGKQCSQSSMRLQTTRYLENYMFSRPGVQHKKKVFFTIYSPRSTALFLTTFLSNRW